MTRFLSRATLIAVAIGAGGCSLGPSELLIILAIVLLLFGATRLPQLGKALGDTIKSFRESTASDKPEIAENEGESVKIEEAKVEPKKIDEGEKKEG